MRSCTRSANVTPFVVGGCRFLSGNKGRGDLRQPRGLSDASRNRVMGMQRGLRLDSQSTHPQTGQLYVKKQIAHNSKNSVSSGSGHLAPEIAKWSYLIPSLHAGIVKSLPGSLFEKCTRGDVLTSEEAQKVSEVNRLVRFEIHQRIPLLEDSLAHAELHYMVEWPCLFRRACLRLPLAGVRAALQLAVPLGNPLLLSGGAAAAGGQPLPVVQDGAQVHAQAARSPAAAAAAATWVPATHQIHELDARIAKLTQHVQAFVEADFAKLGKVHASGTRSARQEASEAKLRKKWAEALEWHLRAS